MDGYFFRPLKSAAAVLASAALTMVCATGHAQDKPIRIGLVTFLSGPAAGPFGVPAKIAAVVAHPHPELAHR